MAIQVSRYRFGPFDVHPTRRELHKHGIKLKLRPQPYLVLQVLVQRAGEVVTREELHRSLWPAETFVDFEHGLNTSVKELRRILGDSAGEPRYIETLPRLGYRFLVPVETETMLPAAEAAATGPPAEANAPAAPPPRQQRWRWLAVAGGVAVLLSAAVYWRLDSARIRPQVAGRRVMLAVLPFENLTGDLAQDYLSDGITEEMIGQLGRLNPKRFGIIARTSVMHYKQGHQGVRHIGEELNVQYVLEGSVRRDSNRLRVSAQLIRTEDETHIWARQYDRDWASLLIAESEIAREISDEIESAFGGAKTAAPISRRVASEPESVAYDLYLKGLYFWNKRSIEGFRRAIGYFEEAIARYPNNARAYAGLADCYALIGGYSSESLDEYIVKARASALHALQLDETLPEAHTALAVIVQNYDHDWRTAENEFRRAIELNPSYATGHHWYAEHLGYVGRFEEAFKESERARQLDPLSPIIATDNARLLYYSRQYDRAIEKCRSVLELDPGFEFARSWMLSAYIAKGMFPEGLQLAQQLPHTADSPLWFWSHLAEIYAHSGQSAQLHHALEQIRRQYRPGQTDPAIFIRVYLAMRNKEAAFAWLEKAYAQHSNEMTVLKVDPVYDPLRNDPRFQDLMHRVGLTQ